MQTKYLLFLPLSLGGALLAGCNGNTSDTSAQSAAQSSAQNGASNGASNSVQTDAPEGSSAEEAKDKTGAGNTDAMAVKAPTTNLLFTSTPSTLPVGKTAIWTLQINDAQSGEPVKDFTVVHDKLMHLIVVKKDLSWFNHIHPEHKGNGKFVVSTALPTSGDYKLYADYTPKGKAQEVPSHEFSTIGATQTIASPQLVPDKMNGAWMTKKVVAHPEGEPNAKGGAAYEVALMPMPMPLKAGADSMLHFQVRDAKGTPIKDLQPYLGAMGHCVILSQDTSKYLHSHPMAEGEKHDMSKMSAGDMSQMNHAAPPKSGGPDVMFHTNFPTAGVYKTWGQFMHKGKIITAAFVVNVAAGEAKPAGGDAATHDHDSAEPHNH